jgi:hypothetical protein
MVYVMTPYEISQIAMASIQGELHERGGQVMFLVPDDFLASSRNITQTSSCSSPGCLHRM